MKSIICPHCGHKIAAAQLAHANSRAVRLVLKKAKRPQCIFTLATLYAQTVNADYSSTNSKANSIIYASARRAIERLAQDGYLTRLEPGIYQTKA